VRSRRWRPWIGFALAALLAPGCAVSGLAFAQDDRIEIEAPGDNETVSLPFEVRWSARDYDGRFVVLFDRTPMRPGRHLRSLVPAGDPCLARSSCPDEEWLAERHVFVTSDTRITVEDLPEERTNNRAKDRHEMTIVLLDDDGKRLGESVFVREFVVDRED
jgi:hypothetical protein